MFMSYAWVRRLTLRERKARQQSILLVSDPHHPFGKKGRLVERLKSLILTKVIGHSSTAWDEKEILRLYRKNPFRQLFRVALTRCRQSKLVRLAQYLSRRHKSRSFPKTDAKFQTSWSRVVR